MAMLGKAFASLSALLARTPHYGVDCSFPHHQNESISCGELLGADQKSVYVEYMKGCREYYGEDAYEYCDEAEEDRLYENREAVQHMYNFTKTGYHKTTMPAETMRYLYTYWLMYKDEPRVEEEFPPGDHSVNHWAVPAYMVDLYDQNESHMMVHMLYETVKTKLENWTGMEQRPVSLYGIRVYETGAVLSPHIDRHPLVTSVIINVDQDTTEPWPLEVIGRDGRAVNITMVAGDMVFYESHSLVHGRPFPLKGHYMANVFAHFEPTGRLVAADGSYYWKDGEEPESGLPPYIIPGSPGEAAWRKSNPGGWRYEDPRWGDDDEEEDYEEWDDDDATSEEL